MHVRIYNIYESLSELRFEALIEDKRFLIIKEIKLDTLKAILLACINNKR